MSIKKKLTQPVEVQTWHRLQSWANTFLAVFGAGCYVAHKAGLI